MESGSVLRVAMAAAGVSVNDLANQVGVSRQTVSAWRSGTATPSGQHAAAVAGVLGLSADELFSPAEGNPARVTVVFEGVARQPAELDAERLRAYRWHLAEARRLLI